MDSILNATRPTTDALALLAGGGEMGERTRNFDWSCTPLGPIASWPQSLKTVVRIMLDSRYAMWLGWGPEFTFLYNDAYARMTLGPKHPWALGRSAREVWAEIWNEIGPRAESVVRTGVATWDEGLLLFLQRRGFPEETYHTFSYSPVPNDAGGVGGMLCVVTEDTLRTIGERRIKTLRELAARTTEEDRSTERAGQMAARILAANPNDHPFALVYLLADNGTSAHLAGATGMTEASPAAPPCWDLKGAKADRGSWPFAAVVKTRQSELVTALDEKFGSLHGNIWPEPPNSALVLPISKAGQDHLAGFLVAGISPRLELDDNYRGYLELVSGHIASAIDSARAYEEERRRAEALAELDRAKTAFFSNVSHEFRTPLTLMLGPVDDMLAKPDDQVRPEDRDLLRVVHRNGLRLQKLVNTLLDFSRIEAGRMRAGFEPTDLAAMTADLASNFRSACDTAGLQLTIDCPPLPEPVYVDREMWEKIVLNLLSNAFKYTLQGGIEVHLHRTDGNVQLVVRDTGSGIPVDQLPHLFERFHRVEGVAARTQEGSGIGLALVRELARLHGGDVRAESRLGEGSAFFVTIPRGKDHLPQDRIHTAETWSHADKGATAYVEEALRWLPKPGDRGQESGDRWVSLTPESHLVTPGSRPRILLADDNTDMRDYICRLLAHQFDVLAVADGVAACDAALASPPDLVISDVMMPGLDGFGLIKALRDDSRTATVPVILLSARAGEEARVEGLQAGADDYLIKPFSARELVARVEARLELAKLRRQGEKLWREMAEELHRSEQRFRDLSDAMPQIVWTTGPDGEINYSNRRWFEYSGAASGVGNDNWRAIVHPDDGAAAQKRWSECTRTGEPFECELRLFDRRTGGYHWHLIRTVPVRDGSGKIAHWYGTATDIDEQKRATDSARFVAEASAELATLVDYESTLQKVAKLAVPYFADWCGVDVLEEGGKLRQLAVAHQDPSQVDLAHEFVRRYPPDLNLENGIGGVLRSGKPRIVPEITDEMLVKGARDETHLEMIRRLGLRSYICVPVIVSGKALGAITFATAESGRTYVPSDLTLAEDLVHRAAIAIENARLYRALKEADRKKDEFLAVLAHELRNPLAPLSNALQVMRLAGVSGPAEQVRDMMIRQVQQMTRLVDDLLDVSRITRGKFALRKERLDLADVIMSALETSRPLIEAAMHQLTVTPPRGPLFVEGDKTRLAQVLANLLTNAAKYTPEGGHIRLIVEKDKDSAVIRVRDDGLGIPPDMLPRIFDMFTQVDHNVGRAQGGLGIGLTIVRNLVEMHGGKVEAHSAGAGRGSEFVVRLPLAADQPVSSSTTEGNPTVQAAERMPQHRVLIVDDNVDSVNSLALMLRLQGYEVRTAHNGGTALQTAADFNPEVVLLDIGMPDMDGYEVARRMRKLPALQNAVLIAQTGWGQEHDRRRSAEAGFNHHFTKPIDLTLLDKLFAGITRTKTEASGRR
jgi:PAS domain S-box-containing protein